LTHSDGDQTYLYAPDGTRLAEGQSSEWRYHLSDALGSTRQLADPAGVVVGLSTYEPYGAVLSQSGESSVFQFAGEATDPSGLTFLRARYLDTGTGRFISHDSWPGDRLRPQSMNGWNYVENNPLNLTDPTGQFPEYCRTALTITAYENCVRSSFHLEPIDEIVSSKVKGFPGCYEGPISYRAPGYIEGTSTNVSPAVGAAFGKEIAHDFATMEWQTFTYQGLAFGPGISEVGYTGFIVDWSGGGFRSWKNIESDYSGFFNVVNAGAYGNLGALGINIHLSIGAMAFAGHPDSSIQGFAFYDAISNGSHIDTIGFEEGGNIVFYEPTGDVQPHYQGYSVPADPNNPEAAKKVDPSLVNTGLFIKPSPITQTSAQQMADEWIKIFNGINYDSWFIPN